MCNVHPFLMFILFNQWNQCCLSNLGQDRCLVLFCKSYLPTYANKVWPSFKRGHEGRVVVSPTHMISLRGTQWSWCHDNSDINSRKSPQGKCLLRDTNYPACNEGVWNTEWTKVDLREQSKGLRSNMQDNCLRKFMLEFLHFCTAWCVWASYF